jgi:hypothetical protein
MCLALYETPSAPTPRWRHHAGFSGTNLAILIREFY